MSDKNKIIASKVQKLRKNKNLSQKEFAEKAGVSVGTIQRIEGAIGSPTVEMLSILSKALDVSIDALFQNCIVISVANTKGGSGKSTISSHLARVLYEMTEAKMLVYDTDIQKSIFKPYIQNDHNLPIDCKAFDHSKRFVSKDALVRSDIERYRNDYEIIIVDSPGNFESFSFISEIISSSDFTIVPFQLTRMGLEGTEFIEKLLEETNENRRQQGKQITKAFALASMVNKVTHEYKMLSDIEFSSMEVLKNSVSSSIEYTRSDTLDSQSNIKEFRKVVKEFIQKANI